MTSSLHVKATIIEHAEVAPGCYKIVAHAPELAQSALPGQFVHVHCTPIGCEPLLRRPLGIHWADPESGRFALVYEVHGRGTKLLSERVPGETLDILGPLGHGFDLPKSSDQPVVLIGGGMGVVPLRFLADSIKKSFGSECMTFIMGACTVDKLFARDDFQSFCIENSAEWQYFLCTDDGTCGHHGFVTDVLREYMERCAAKKPLIYACGPTPMLRSVAQISASYDAKCQVSTEAKMACGIGACMSCVVKVRSEDGFKYLRACKDGPVFDAAEVIWE